MLFQGPTLPGPVYHWLAIFLTRDTGVWAQPLEMKHSGMGTFQGVPCHSRGPHSQVLCTISWPSVSHGTLGCGPSPSRWTTLGWDHSKVFHVIPGAHIPMSCVPPVSHRSYTGHWDVGPPVRDGAPWNGIIPRCSVSFQGLASLCPMYYGLAIGLTWDTGMWAQPLEMDHPGMGSFQGVPCHSRGTHPHVPCTISRPLALHRTLGCGATASRWNTLVWDNSRVFYAIPGAHILVSSVLSIGHWSHTGPWDVGPPVQDGTPGMGSFQGVPCHSRGRHPGVLCTISQP